MRDERDTRVSDSNHEQLSFIKKKLSFQFYNFPFIVGEGERNGRGDASRCFARAWAVTPVLINLTILFPRVGHFCRTRSGCYDGSPKC